MIHLLGSSSLHVNSSFVPPSPNLKCLLLVKVPTAHYFLAFDLPKFSLGSLSSAEAPISKQQGKRKRGRSERKQGTMPGFPARFISLYPVSARFFSSVQSKRDCKRPLRRRESKAYLWASKYLLQSGGGAQVVVRIQPD